MELTTTGKVVYDRTYSRPKPDGTKETWPETVERVVNGNLALVPEKYHLKGEREALIRLITEFKIIPGGRHLWASGVKGRQYLFNCHVSGWGEKLSDHFEFTFMRLMEGGGVGANYSNSYLEQYPALAGGPYVVHIVCDTGHPDYLKLKSAGVLSEDYTSEWEGAFDIEDSREGWAAALVDLMDTYGRKAKNTNRVYDVSRVREEGARLKTFGGRASGPLPLAKMLIEVSHIMNRARANDRDVTGMDAMKIDHSIANCVVSGGVRRSARMSMMHWNDPQIFEFLKCKADGDHWTTNISVVLDDEFFRILNVPINTEKDHWDVYYPVAEEILRGLAEGMLHNGEPGFWNYSLSQVGEPNEVVCTNPCGEITLEEWENCNLGHVNLAAFVDEHGVDSDEIGEAHRYITRFLIRATYGDVTDHKQSEVLLRNRRIGVGHLGVASMLAMEQIKYSEAAQDFWFRYVLKDWAREVDEEAYEYCHQLRIPIPVKKRTVAPTGTIAKMPGVSEGIHPIFAKYYDRRIRFSMLDPEQWETCMDYANRGFHVEPSAVEENTMIVTIPTKDILMEQVDAIHGEGESDYLVETPEDLTLDQMAAFQAMYQEYWADNAVSFTANIDPDKYTADDVMEIIKTWGPRLKGMTIFPEKSFNQAPYTRITKQDYQLSSVKSTDSSVDDECATGACPVR